MKIKILAAALVASVLALTPLAKADSITLQNHTGNTYTYALTFDTSPVNIFFMSGFGLTGLSNVTNAVLSGPLADDFDVVFDSTTVIAGTDFAIESGSLPFSVGTLTVTSSALPGLVDYAILNLNGLSTGQVLGPGGSAPSPVPEPSSLILLGSGLLAGAGAMRRKLFA